MKFDTSAAANTIRSKYPNVFAQFEIEHAIALLDSIDETRPYHNMPAAVSEYWAAIGEKFGSDVINAFHSLTLLQLIQQFDDRSQNRT